MIYSVFLFFSLKESIKMHVSGDLIETCLHFCKLGLANPHNELTIKD